MNLDEAEKDIYNRLTPKEQYELKGVWDNTALLEKVPKVLAAFLFGTILLAFIF